MTALALLPSPLLGPAVWAPVADLLAGAGWTVVRVGARPAGPTSTPDDVLAALLDALPPDDEHALVPHSNAGLYVPALAAERRVRAAVFVDAGLPPAQGSVELAPAHFRQHLRQKADADGVLPPWSRWWDEPDVAALFPDRAARAAVEAEQPRLPLSYFASRLAVPAGWDRTPCGYLSFGEAYADERSRAARRGWPVDRLPGDHLHMLVDPPSVATGITRLLAALGVRLGGG